MKYRLYKSLNIKIDYKIDIINKIMSFLKTKNIFGKDKIRDNNACISILWMEDHIRDKIDLIDNKNEKK